MRTEPILKLKDEEIRALFLDSATGKVLVGTSQGRILIVSHLGTNAYMAGNRTIYATRTNDLGVESPVSSVNVRHGLMDKVVELTSGFSITRWKDVVGVLGAESVQAVSGTFTSPVLWAGEDFGWWGDASWTQSVGENSRAIVSVRIAGSEEALLASGWVSVESAASGATTMSLDASSTAGAYAQVRVVLASTLGSENPTISNLVVPYHAKHASYFFLTKISMKKGSSISGGMLTAAVSVPRNTEVKWGISSGNSSNWNDYLPIKPGETFSLPAGFGDRGKIGVKLLAYDDQRYPIVDEFAVAFDASIDNLLNK